MIKSLSTTHTTLKKLYPVADKIKLFQKSLNLYLPMEINPVRRVSILRLS